MGPSSVPMSRDVAGAVVVAEEHECSVEEVMLTTLALRSETLLERPIVMHGEEARMGRPDPDGVVDWLKDRM